VTVIGAGPAGALLAYLLVKRGLKVVLVEKARLPRVKPCGGGLNWKTVRLLPFAIDAVVERIVSRAASAACPWTPDTLYIDWGSHPQTYAWAFPKATHWSIGVKGPALQGHALAHYLRQFMQRWQLTPTDGKLHYLAHMLPACAPGTLLVGECALVLGDAAGLLEPFTGEGIYYALHSAYLAAEALTAASISDTSPWSYERAVDTEIMPELAGGRALQRVFDAWPWFFHSMVRAALWLRGSRVGEVSPVSEQIYSL
jgi:flavin-dependent dehydrogenase